MRGARHGARWGAPRRMRRTMRGVVCGAMRSAPSGKNVAGVRAARHAAPAAAAHALGGAGGARAGGWRLLAQLFSFLWATRLTSRARAGHMRRRGGSRLAGGVGIFPIHVCDVFFRAPRALAASRAAAGERRFAISRIISRSEHNRKSDRKRTPRYITTQRMRSNRQLQAAVKMSRSIIAVLSARGTARREIQRQARKKKKEMEGREGPRP